MAMSVIPLAATVSEFDEENLVELLRSLLTHVDSIATTRLMTTR